MTGSHRIIANIVIWIALSCTVPGQTPTAPKNSGTDNDAILGKWDCVAKGTGAVELKATMELNNENNKIVALCRTTLGVFSTDHVTWVEGRFSAVFTTGDNTTGKFSGRIKDGKLAGGWSYGTEFTGNFECSRAGSEASVKLASSNSTGELITGAWEVTLNSPNSGETKVTFQLKLDGAKLAGTVSTAEHTAQIKAGSWADDKLTISVELPNGLVNFTGALQDGKLSGRFDTAGQAGGTWRASKKPREAK